MRDVPTLTEAGVAEDAHVASALPDPEESVTEGGGLLGRLFRGPDAPAPQASDAVDQSLEESGAIEESTADVVADDAPDMVERRERRGLFGLLRRADPGETPDGEAAEVEVASVEPTEVSPDTQVSEDAGKQGGFLSFLRPADAPAEDLPPRVDQGTEPEAETDTGGGPGLAALFRRDTGRADPTRWPDAREVPPGTLLPYGEVARQCTLSPREMGREIDRFPDRGNGYRLYDSDPGNTAPHTFYITGFSDGCARQVTAALAVFGSPSMHEKIRYGLPADLHPYSTTDKAYETLKSRICGVSRNAPCGARIGTIERNTVFLSLYERFEDNARWADMLLHDGHVLAKDVKTP